MKNNTLDFDAQINDFKLLRPDLTKPIRQFSVRYYDLWNGSMFKYDSTRTLLIDFNKLKKTFQQWKVLLFKRKFHLHKTIYPLRKQK